MKNKKLNKTHQEIVAKALKPYMAKAITPILSKLGIFQQKNEWNYNMDFSLRYTFTVPARKIEFTDYEIREATKKGKFPSGMTAADLEDVVSNGTPYIHDTCLDQAARNGKMPRGTTLNDLLGTRGGKKRRAIFSLFESQQIRYPAGVTAQDLFKIKQHRWGTFLHEAARSGVYPKNTTVSDLMTCQNREGKTPLHIAAQFGGLIPCSKADLSQVTDAKGKTPWDYAVETFGAPNSVREHWHHYYKTAVNNIIMCPTLAAKLRPQKNEFHQAVLTELLVSPKLTPELRDQLAKYPQICAAML